MHIKLGLVPLSFEYAGIFASASEAIHYTGVVDAAVESQPAKSSVPKKICSFSTTQPQKKQQLIPFQNAHTPTRNTKSKQH